MIPVPTILPRQSSVAVGPFPPVLLHQTRDAALQFRLSRVRQLMGVLQTEHLNL